MDLVIQSAKPVEPQAPVRGEQRAPAEAGKSFRTLLDALAAPAAAPEAAAPAPEPGEAAATPDAAAAMLATPVAVLVMPEGLLQPPPVAGAAGPDALIAAPASAPAGPDLFLPLPPTDAGAADPASTPEAPPPEGAPPAAPEMPRGAAPQEAPAGDAAGTPAAPQAAPEPQCAEAAAAGAEPQAPAEDAGAAGADPTPSPRDPAPLLVQTGAEAARTAAQPTLDAAAPRHLVAAGVPVDQVAVHLRRAADGGADRIEIHLSPASLGQVEVELEVAPDGRVDAVVRVERPETLELLQRDARQLVRALQDAGLQADGGSLSFHLRGDDQRQAGQGWTHAAAQPGGRAPERGGADAAAPLPEIRRVARGGIDIRV